MPSTITRMIDNAAADHRNIERYLGSDHRFTPRRDTFGQWHYDYYDPATGDRHADLLQFEALSLKADLDVAADPV
jgi:hypothetical protein